MREKNKVILFNKFKKKLNNYKRLALRKCISILPKNIRFPLIRKIINIPTTLPEGFEFKIAETKSEFEQVCKILHDAYVNEGFMKPEESGMRVHKYFLLPTTVTLIVLYNNKVVGTMSIIRRTNLGLPMEHQFDLSNYLKDGRAVAEISSLAIDKNFKGQSGTVFFAICKYFHEIITTVMNIQKVFIAVNPSMADFYEGLLLFDKINEKKISNYQFANGAPAVGLYADYSNLESRFIKVYSKKNDAKNLHKFMCYNKISQFTYPIEKYSKSMYPIMDASMINYFFKEKSNVLSELSIEELKYIKNMYPPSLSNIFNKEISSDGNLKTELAIEANSELSIRDFRVFTANLCELKIKDKGTNTDITISQVLNASHNGLMIGGSKVQHYIGEIIHFSVQISKKVDVLLYGLVKWSNEASQVGIELIGPIPNEWNQYITFLHDSFQQERDSVLIECKFQTPAIENSDPNNKSRSVA